MTISKKTLKNAQRSNAEPISLRNRIVNRQRQRNRLYEFVMRTLERECAAKGIKRVDLAQMLEKDPSQITRWLSGPANWEFDTVSDLLLCIGGEMTPTFNSFEEYKTERHNFFHDLASEPRSLRGAGTVSSDVSISVQMSSLVNQEAATDAS